MTFAEMVVEVLWVYFGLVGRSLAAVPFAVVFGLWMGLAGGLMLLEYGGVLRRFVPLVDWDAARLRIEAVGEGVVVFVAWVRGQASVGDLRPAGVYARRYARIMREGGMVLPMAEIETDTRNDEEVGGPVAIEQNRSVLLAGQPGAGKTEAFRVLLDQLVDRDSDEPMVVVDVKTTFQDIFDEAGIEYIRVHPRASTVSWNVFREAADEQDYRQIAELIVGELAADEYWGVAAKQVILGLLILLSREWENPSNEDLVEYLRRTDVETIHEHLEKHVDLAPSAKHIPENEHAPQTAGVISNVQANMLDMFFGDFAASPGPVGGFCVREYMERPEGRILLLDVPATMSGVVAPLYKMLIDRAIRHSLVDGRPAKFVLDEFDELPELDEVGTLVNRGREYNSQGIVGLQSIAQLRATYGRDEADALIGGFTQSILMQPGDPATVDFELGEIGGEVAERRVADYDNDGSVSGTVREQTRRDPVPEPVLRNFKPGECVVTMRSGAWVHGRASLLEDVKEVLGEARELARRDG